MSLKKLSGSLQKDLPLLKQMFGDSMDLYAKKLRIRDVECAACMFDGLSSTEKLWVILLDLLSREGPPMPDGAALTNYILHASDLPVEATPVETFDDLVTRMTAGMTVLLVDGSPVAVALSSQLLAYRSVSEPSGEGNIRGSREGFCDLLRVNISLLRRLIRTPDLVIEMHTAGDLTGTEVALCYNRRLAPPELVEKVRQRLQNTKIPLLLDSSYLAPFLQKGPFSFFQQAGYTERSAAACAKICEGKLVLLVNGSPFAMILPHFFIENFQSLDDYATKAYFASLLRALKFLAFLLAVMLPGVYVAIAQFSPELFPPQLLYKVAAAERATPLPLFLEMIFVLILLEIVREAGLRLPKPIGHTVSLVSALIVGDAAINAGILSTPVVIVAAFTSISMFVIPALYEPATALRLLFTLAGGVAGLLGVACMFAVMAVSACNTDFLGMPYTAPLVPARPGMLRDGMFRFSWRVLARRPYTIREEVPPHETED